MEQHGLRLVIGMMGSCHRRCLFFRCRFEKKTVPELPGGFFDAKSLFGSVSRNVSFAGPAEDPPFRTAGTDKSAFLRGLRAQSVIKNGRDERLFHFIQQGQ